MEKKKISTTYDFIFNLPATSIQPPNYIKAYKGFLNNQLRYRLEIRSENTTDINGQPFSEIHKMQAIINPSTNIIRSIEYFEEIVALKDDPSKFTHSYYETFISQDRDPSTIDWGDLPIDDDTE